MAEQANCPKCGELTLAEKRTRINPKTGKTLSWPVHLIPGGILLGLAGLFITDTIVSLTHYQDSLYQYLLWIFFGMALFFGIPGTLMIYTYAKGVNTPLFKCYHCQHKWTRREEEFKLQELARKRRKEESITEKQYLSVHCPYCGGQQLYKGNSFVYCDNGSCPHGKEPVDIDRYNLRRFISN